MVRANDTWIQFGEVCRVGLVALGPSSKWVYLPLRDPSGPPRCATPGSRPRPGSRTAARSAETAAPAPRGSARPRADRRPKPPRRGTGSSTSAACSPREPRGALKVHPPFHYLHLQKPSLFLFYFLGAGGRAGVELGCDKRDECDLG